MDKVLKDRQHKVQIGNNKNLVDWTYAGNVADAHLLAADHLPDFRSIAKSQPHPVAGRVFFITNGTPLPGWDFSRMMWRELGAPPQDLEPKNVTVVPRRLALALAHVVEAFSKILGTTTNFTVFAVRYVTATQWYNIDNVRAPFLFVWNCFAYVSPSKHIQARKVLGYDPKVSLEEAVRLTAEVGTSLH